MKLTFLGGAGEVTGSCYLVEADDVRFLVDCGLFQGGREAGPKNRARFAFDPRRLDFVLLTHAHIDHSGLLPRLVAEGYAGPIYATSATCDLVDVMLRDSAHIQEKEAEWKAKGGSRRRAAIPLYTVVQAERALRQMRAIEYGADVKPHPHVRCVYRDAGHILGSAIIEVWVEAGGHSRKVVFSGDLGQPMRPIVRDPATVTDADVLLVESTYGNRLHKTLDETMAELEHAITDTLERKRGNIIIPAFAVGRTQDLLFLLADLYRRGRLPDMTVYVDSPMATKATAITMSHARLLDEETSAMLAWLKGHRGHPSFRFVEKIEESIGLHRVKSGAIIIAASGMCEAGRIKYHLRHNLGRPECTILITGFQAEGTLGRRIVDGAKEVRIFGIRIPVRAEVYTVGGLSAHADQAALLAWLKRFRRPPRQTFVVHGEYQTARAFAAAIQQQLGWRDVAIPEARSAVTL